MGQIMASHSNDDFERLRRVHRVLVMHYVEGLSQAEIAKRTGLSHPTVNRLVKEGHERGYVQITDRKKDMYIVGGFNAYPAEIEGFLLEHPAVSQVAVIGVPDDRMGQVGKAFVVARADFGAPPSADDVIAWSRERMAGYKVPRYVEFLDELPTNATGKVVKDRLR